MSHNDENSSKSTAPEVGFSVAQVKLCDAARLALRQQLVQETANQLAACDIISAQATAISALNADLTVCKQHISFFEPKAAQFLFSPATVEADVPSGSRPVLKRAPTDADVINSLRREITRLNAAASERGKPLKSQKAAAEEKHQKELSELPFLFAAGDKASDDVILMMEADHKAKLADVQKRLATAETRLKEEEDKREQAVLELQQLREQSTGEKAEWAVREILYQSELVRLRKELLSMCSTLTPKQAADQPLPVKALRMNEARRTCGRHRKEGVHAVQQCTLCPVTYTSRYLLQKHVATSHHEQYLGSNKCRLPLFRPRLLKGHSECQHCKRSCVSKRGLKIYCATCQLKLKSRVKKTSNLMNRFIQCFRCLNMFQDRLSLADHLTSEISCVASEQNPAKMEVSEQSVKCPLGQTKRSRFKREPTSPSWLIVPYMEKRMQRKRAARVAVQNKCLYCSKKFKTFWHLRRHLIVHQNSSSYQCVRCLMTYNYSDELEKHLVNNACESPMKIVKRRELRCGLVQESDQTAAKKALVGTDTEQFQCHATHIAVLDQPIRYPLADQASVMTLSTQSQEYCNMSTVKPKVDCISLYCDTTFETLKSQAHKRRKHSNEHGYRCFRCSKAYRHMQDLVIHLQACSDAAVNGRTLGYGYSRLSDQLLPVSQKPKGGVDNVSFEEEARTRAWSVDIHIGDLKEVAGGQSEEANCFSGVDGKNGNETSGASPTKHVRRCRSV